MMIQTVNKYKDYFLAFFGLMIFISFLWFKFIRTRLPRSIPFELTLLKIILLIITCNLLIYGIFLIIKKNTKGSSVIIDYMFHPLGRLHNITQRFINYNIILEYSLTFIKKHIYMLVILEFFLKVVTLIIFLCDVLIFNKLQYVYYGIYFYLYIYLLKYYSFLIKSEIEQKATFVDERVTTQIYNMLEPILPAKYCIEKQAENLLIFEKIARFILVPKIDFIVPEGNAGRRYDWKKVLIPQLNTILLQCVEMNAVIMRYNNYKSKLKYIQLIILILYFTGWLYILIISMYNTTMEDWLLILKGLSNLLQHLNHEIVDPFANM